MRFRIAFNFAAFAALLALDSIVLVKGQPRKPDCKDGDRIIEEIKQLKIEFSDQIQSLLELHASLKLEMKSEHSIVMRRLVDIDRRLDEHVIHMKNQTEDVLKLALGFPVKEDILYDFGDGPVLLPIENHWIIVMNRFDGSLDFNKNWTEYRDGFGDIGRGEFWLGNEIIHRLTTRVGSVYSLRVEVYTEDRWFYADYSTFSLDSEDDNYTLHVSGFSGNAGDSLTNRTIESRWYHSGMAFSTFDNDNDKASVNVAGIDNCAMKYHAGWWFNGCWYSCLTCQYGDDFNWYSLSDLPSKGALGAARMMIKNN